MELIQHTINWAKGEILEAIIMAVFGALIVVCSLLFWKFGATPYAKAMIVPLLVVGSIPLLTGISVVSTNSNRIAEYQAMWQENPQAFTIAEKQRVESFDAIFKYSYPGAMLFTIGGAILFFVLSSPLGKAISLAMMVLGLMAYVIDHFAAERAAIYLEYIEQAMAYEK